VGNDAFSKVPQRITTHELFTYRKRKCEKKQRKKHWAIHEHAKQCITENKNLSSLLTRIYQERVHQ